MGYCKERSSTRILWSYTVVVALTIHLNESGRCMILPANHYTLIAEHKKCSSSLKTSHALTTFE